MIVRSRGPSSRRGFSLVEMLIAAVIMAAILIPLLTVMFNNRRGNEEIVMRGEAMSIASNIMEKLISPSIPFDEIDPAGGSEYVKGLANTNQAGFRDGGAQAFYEKSLADDHIDEPGGPGGLSRVIRGGPGKKQDYFVYFFAGKYPDDPQQPDTNESTAAKEVKRPDFDRTLTFLYLENPARYGVPYNLNEADNDPANPNNPNIHVILATEKTGDQIETIPYMLTPRELRGKQPPNNIPTDDPYKHTNSENFRKIVGWPVFPGEQTASCDYSFDGPGKRAAWGQRVRDVVTSSSGQKPTMGFHPRVVDQATFRLEKGAFMKVIVGVKYYPHQGKSITALGKSVASGEFWLTSFKAKLEDE